LVIALKGKGTKGVLIPKKGRPDPRFFRAPAGCFLVQYWGQIDESILELMKNFAIAKSVSEWKRIYYGAIDGRDTMRILTAYPEVFSTCLSLTNRFGD